jgi:predicted AlkP superfamily phosphohydrolase/phosphomutase
MGRQPLITRRAIYDHRELTFQWWGCLLAELAVVAAVTAVLGCRPEESSHRDQVIVLGFDGMDPELCVEMMAAGELPNLSALAKQGSFTPLGTSTPPQSPVAWSNLITGADSGQHGVFDFVHRDAKTMMPRSFAAEPRPPKPLPLIGHSLDSLSLFGFNFPLRSATLETNRGVPAFWEYLTRAGVPAHVFRMPANYPPTASTGAHFCCLSDMGTPDLTDTLGTFSYFTEDPDERYLPMAAGGGELYPIDTRNHRAIGTIVGPVNGFRKTPAGAIARLKSDRAKVPFRLYRDPSEPVATIEYADTIVLLSEGEWSDWQPVEFEMIPYVISLKGAVRFYLKAVHPFLKLYVSPINFDPQEKSWQIDQPDDWSVTVSNAVGRYYTQGLPEETKALSNNVFSRDEYLRQADVVFQERLKMLDFALGHYSGGLLFFYFGTSDQIGHMFWGAREPGHPAITPDEHRKYRRVMEDVYVKLDDVVGEVRERFPEATLLVMSDHGFNSYRRTFNLNTWLRDEGYAAMLHPDRPATQMNFDFTKTKAYALGLNALYVNLRGRESAGIVDPQDKERLMDEIIAKLVSYRDPVDGAQPVMQVYRADQIYHGPDRGGGPDLVIGYADGYRGGGASGLGVFRPEVVEDNLDAWCGDHCVDPRLAKGVLFSSRRIVGTDPSLVDLAPTILRHYDVEIPDQMIGKDLFSAASAERPQRSN